MSARQPVLGAVLAGGASSRFGSDKALAMVDGRTLLDHARAAIAPFVDAVVVVGRGEVADLPCAGMGPLGGIAGALDHARRQGFDSVLTVACDMMRVPDGLFSALLELAPSYCADTPVLGHWPTTLAVEVADRLASLVPSCDVAVSKDRHRRDVSLSVRRWAISIGAAAISSPTPIANINTPADLPS